MISLFRQKQRHNSYIEESDYINISLLQINFNQSYGITNTISYIRLDILVFLNKHKYLNEKRNSHLLYECFL